MRSTSPTPPLDDPSTHSTTPRRVSYFYDPDVGGFAYPYQHPMKPHRMRMAHALIGAYGMLGKMQVVRPRRANELDLTRFHTDEYIEFLKSINAENYMEWTANKKFCQTDDCPPWDGLWDFTTLTAGSSISAAHSLVTGHSDIAIAWAGGLHHAKRAEASGFCYVNDIVLGILELLRVHARVLYVDIDIHHGDGVEEAFYTTDRVMTCSFHKFGDFFPGTGTVGDTGKGRGEGYAVNFPLKDGLTDEQFVDAFKSVVGRIMEWYRPGAVVLQGGADSLAGDKLGAFNLSMHGHAACAAYLRTFNVPLLMVGGGGYTVKNVSRTWTYETAVAIGCTQDISPDLPNNEYLEWFGPRYKLEVLRNNMENWNSQEAIEAIKQRIWENMRGLPFAPSAGLKQEMGERKPWRWGGAGKKGEWEEEWEEEDSDWEDLDRRISQRLRDKHTKAQEDPLTDSDSSTYDSDEDHPHAQSQRTLRSRKAPRKQRHSERFRSPSASELDSDADSDAGENGYARRERARRIYAPRKKPRTFFSSPASAGPAGAFMDPRLLALKEEELLLQQEEKERLARREQEAAAFRAMVRESVERELASLGERVGLPGQVGVKEREEGGRRERERRERERSVARGKDVGVEEDVDMDVDADAEEEKAEAEKAEAGEEDEQDEDGEGDEEEGEVLEPKLHPAAIAIAKSGKEEDEDEDDKEEQEEQRENEEKDEDEQEDEEDDARPHGQAEVEHEEHEHDDEEEDEDAPEAEAQVDVEMEDDENPDDGDGDEEGEEPEAPAPQPQIDDDGSDLSDVDDDEDAGAAPEVRHDEDGDGDDEADEDLPDEEDGTGTIIEEADEGHPAPEDDQDADDADADAGHAEADADMEDDSRVPSPSGEAAAGSPEAEIESSEPSTVSLSRSPTGSPRQAGEGGADASMEEGEVDEGEREPAAVDFRLEALADVAGASEQRT